MPDPTWPKTPAAEDDAEGRHAARRATPTWVKTSGIIAALIVLLLVILLLAGHGPGRHAARLAPDLALPASAAYGG